MQALLKGYHLVDLEMGQLLFEVIRHRPHEDEHEEIPQVLDQEEEGEGQQNVLEVEGSSDYQERSEGQKEELLGQLDDEEEEKSHQRRLSKGEFVKFLDGVNQIV